LRLVAQSAVVVCAAVFLSACSGGGGFIDDGTKFSSAEYGVAASPRLVKSGPVPKGGGRYQVGKPYKVAGKWYTPKDDPGYEATGSASWYGPNFHGRMTANGEVFDQNHLSAAHPTLPLPSYVRVFNMDNGRSTVVRVNDRGPYAHNRVIDVSKRTAEVLGFANQGTARVRVKYVGRAPLEGDDTDYLVASINSPNARMPSASSAPRSNGGGRPSPISREAGGLVGSFIGLFGYAENNPQEAEQLVSEAHAAAASVAGQPGALGKWQRSVDEKAAAVDISLGTYPDAGTAEEIARRFAFLGAVDATPATGRGGAIQLEVTHLKPGVTRSDLADMMRELGVAGAGSL